jgi:hypothetical protein
MAVVFMRTSGTARALPWMSRWMLSPASRLNEVEVGEVLLAWNRARAVSRDDDVGNPAIVD